MAACDFEKGENATWFRHIHSDAQQGAAQTPSSVRSRLSTFLTTITLTAFVIGMTISIFSANAIITEAVHAASRRCFAWHFHTSRR